MAQRTDHWELAQKTEILENKQMGCPLLSIFSLSCPTLLTQSQPIIYDHSLTQNIIFAFRDCQMTQVNKGFLYLLHNCISMDISHTGGGSCAVRGWPALLVKTSPQGRNTHQVPGRPTWPEALWRPSALPSFPSTKELFRDFPGASVNSPHTSARDRGLTSGRGRAHVPQEN